MAETRAVPPALFASGRAGDFAAAAQLGFTHALLDDAALIAPALAGGLTPLIALNKLDQGHLATLQKQGARGFYFRHAHEHDTPAWQKTIATLRERDTDTLLIAGIFGATPEAVAGLSGIGFDYATSSSCYWDYAAAWLQRDTLRTESVASALAFATPPGSFGWHPAALSRALRVSAMFAPAWCVERDIVFAYEADVRALLGLRCRNQVLQAARLISSPGASVSVFQRGNFIAATNRSLQQPASISTSIILSHLGVSVLRMEPDCSLGPADTLQLEPGGVAYLTAEVLPSIRIAPPKLNLAQPRIVIDAITPQIDGDRFPARRIVGEICVVEANFIADGHERLAGELQYRCGNSKIWTTLPMTPLGNDRWQAKFPLARLGRHGFVIRAWIDRFASESHAMQAKFAAGQNISLEISELLLLVKEAAPLDETQSHLAALSEAEQYAYLISTEMSRAMGAALPRTFATKSAELPVDAEPRGASFASWYEIFPRSQSGIAQRHGNFADVVRQLPRIAAMGFDVLYFPPIHPIGQTNRKGRNNSLKASKYDPGSPYAIGSSDGGHDAIHPELGSIEDFRALVEAAARHGLAIALDFAVQCSPDHPWLQDHKDWFAWRPDGSLRHAENPPKKYEDIVNVNFYAKAAMPDLWLALRDIVEFWVGEGINYFRVDNPHTKPLPFWEWMIADIRSRHPNVIFLAEAFTRPAMMYRLAKIGFSQSYSYFTWRNTKAELTAYMRELSGTPLSEFFRPHFFVNTPDINPSFLHHSGRAGFLIRAALAATMSGLFGVYNGFELCEAALVPGKEEYLDSEKYEIKAWNYDQPGNIIQEITMLNNIRRENAALQSHLGIEFLLCDNDQVIYFRKFAPDGNQLLIAISLDPYNIQNTIIELPLWRFGLPDDGALAAEDLLRDTTFVWHGKYQPVSLAPQEKPYCIWRIEPETWRPH